MTNAVLHMMGACALREVANNGTFSAVYVRNLAEHVKYDSTIAVSCNRFLADPIGQHHEFIDDLEEAVNEWEADISCCHYCRSSAGNTLEHGFHQLCKRRFDAGQYQQPLLTVCASCQGTGKAQDDGPCGLCAGDGALS